MRGSQTPPEKIEQIKAEYARTGSYAEVERKLGVPDATVHDIIQSDDQFGEFRKQVEMQYIVKTWDNILTLESALAEKIKTMRPNMVQLRELTGALKDLKSTVENVVQNVNIIGTQNNTVSFNATDMEAAVKWYVQNNPDKVKGWIEGQQ